MNKILTMAVYACLGAVPAMGVAASTIDIDQIHIATTEEYTNGVLDASPYNPSVEVYGSDLSRVGQISVTLPAGSVLGGGVVPLAPIDSTRSVWYLASGYEDNYNTLTDLRSDIGTGDYVFQFYDGLGALLDAVTLNYAAPEPTGVPLISYPSPAAADVPPSGAIITWAYSGTSDGIVVHVADAAGYSQEAIVQSAVTSWAPPPLPASASMELEVRAVDAIGATWDAEGNVILPQHTTEQGDTFVYAGAFEHENNMTFTTVPEPASLTLLGLGAGLLVLWRRTAEACPRTPPMR